MGIILVPSMIVQVVVPVVALNAALAHLAAAAMLNILCILLTLLQQILSHPVLKEVSVNYFQQKVPAFEIQ